MWLVAGLAGLAVLAGASWWWLFRAGRPRVSGSMDLPGLAGTVEIRRDRWGIPHVRAGSIADAFYGQGFVHAQDRLWQMELQRRTAAGRLSEVFGPLALAADRFLRTLGIYRATEAEIAHLDPEERENVEAYCRGVNAVIAGAGGRLPPEFRLLGCKPEPWVLADSLSWAKVMSLGLSLNWEQELLRAKLAQRVGPELAARIGQHYPADQLLITGPEAGEGGDPATELLRGYEAAKPFLSMGTTGASNNWVVSGSRTDTGKPLLANDPHLAVGLPSVWYEAHLAAPGLDVTGATLPGTPGVILGHNQQVAWGFTNSGADVADLYIEKWHPTENACEFEGIWEPVTTIRETIRVKGKPDLEQTVYVTRHGPVLAGGPGSSGPALSLRWATLDPAHIIRAVVGMNTAGSAAEFREALRHWPTPSQNIVFADTEGDIGYVMAGVVPIRKNGTGLTPVPGWTGEYEWTGWVPFEDLPQSWNPDCGYIVTANNAAVDHTYKHHITWDWMPDYRARRIRELLTLNPRVTARDFAAIQMDVYCIPGPEFASHLRHLLLTDPLEQKALALLLAWDGYLTPESTGGAIYQAVVHHALRRAFGAIVGDDLLDTWLGKGRDPVLSPVNINAARALTVLLKELRVRDRSFLVPQDAAAAAMAPDSDPWDSMLAASLADGVAYLRRTLGDDPAGWQWGKLHRLVLIHPMGTVKPLNLIFNGPTLPIGGDAQTPCSVGWVPDRPFAAGAWAPSFRQIADLADLSRSLAVYPGGQSGFPGHRHYLDLFRLWYRGEYHPMLFEEGEIERNSLDRLTLNPAR